MFGPLYELEKLQTVVASWFWPQHVGTLHWELAAALLSMAENGREQNQRNNLQLQLLKTGTEQKSPHPSGKKKLLENLLLLNLINLDLTGFPRDLSFQL